MKDTHVSIPSSTGPAGADSAPVSPSAQSTSAETVATATATVAVTATATAAAIAPEPPSSTKPRRPSGRPRSAGSGPGSGSGPDPTVGLTPQAQRLGLAVLEVLGGLQKPSEAAKALGLSLNRYYQMEIRAVRGLLRACEPGSASGGRPPTAQLAQAEKQVVRLEAENRDLKQEVSRAMALVRAARRTIGLVVPAVAAASTTTNGARGKKGKATATAAVAAAAAGAAAPKDGKPPPTQRRRSKPRVRALHTVARLRANAASEAPSPSTDVPAAAIAAPDRPGG